MASAAGGLRPWSIDGGSPPFESNFDPIELLCSRIPFVDPFSDDYRKFQASGGSTTGPSMLTSLIPVPPVQQTYQEPHHSNTPPNKGFTQLQRVRLSSHQAIHIFIQKTTKTKFTATRLAAEYGISSKAIRDIWTGRSWSQDTRPYWTLLDDLEESFDSPGGSSASPV